VWRALGCAVRSIRVSVTLARLALLHRAWWRAGALSARAKAGEKSGRRAAGRRVVDVPVEFTAARRARRPGRGAMWLVRAVLDPGGSRRRSRSAARPPRLPFRMWIDDGRRGMAARRIAGWRAAVGAGRPRPRAGAGGACAADPRMYSAPTRTWAAIRLAARRRGLPPVLRAATGTMILPDWRRVDRSRRGLAVRQRPGRFGDPWRSARRGTGRKVDIGQPDRAGRGVDAQ